MYEAGSSSALLNQGASDARVSDGEPRAAAHHPMRTCVGCRKKDDQAALLRLVAVDGNGVKTVQVDDYRRMSGRGAWLHPNPACLAQADKRRAFHRAFRAQVDVQAVQRRFQTLEDSPTGRGLETVQPESGSEI